MSSTRFFRFPWATSGDKTAIPDVAPPSGAVSYPQGFGPDYERDPTLDPLAKRVPRDETNQLYFDVTSNLQAWQLAGLPEWVTAAQNGGSAVEYPINSMVRHDQSGGFLTYQSIVDANTAEPGTDETKWMVLSPLGYDGRTYATAGGTAADITATFTPAVSAYVEGTAYRVKMASDCAGATTIDFNGVGQVDLADANGEPLNARAYLAGAYVTMVFDGTGMRITGGALSAMDQVSISTVATQAVANNNPTVLNIAAGSGSNNLGSYTASTFTFSRPGTYAISSSVVGGVTFAGASGTSGVIELRKNGVTITGSKITSQSNQASPVSFPASNAVIVSMTAGATLNVIGSLTVASGFSAASFTSVEVTILPIS